MSETKRVNVNMPVQLYESLKIEAKKLGMPMSGLINFSLNEYIKQNSVVGLLKIYEEEKAKEGR